jgi:hypothetical protein
MEQWPHLSGGSHLEPSPVPRLSILIPALGTPEALETTLLSVLENRPHGCQIVVALGIDYTNPYELDDEVEFFPGAGSGWVQCVNAGLTRCRADVVHILAAGTRALSGWTTPAVAHFSCRETGLVTPWVSDAAEESALAPSGIAGYYRLRMLAELGGFSASVGDQYADLDLALRAAAAGWRTVNEPRSKLHWRAPPPLVRSLRTGLEAERFFWRHLPVRGRAKTLAAHALGLAGEIVTSLWRPRNLLHLAGRLGGCRPAHEVRQEIPYSAEDSRELRRRERTRRAPATTARRRVA